MVVCLPSGMNLFPLHCAFLFTEDVNTYETTNILLISFAIIQSLTCWGFSPSQGRSDRNLTFLFLCLIHFAMTGLSTSKFIIRQLCNWLLLACFVYIVWLLLFYLTFSAFYDLSIHDRLFLRSLVANWWRQVYRLHEMSCHDLEVMGLNPDWAARYLIIMSK